MYNETLPSLAFALNKDTITIDDGAVGESFFQTAQGWETRWIRPNSPSANRYLRRLITAPSVLIIPGDLPARWNWVTLNYPSVEWAGRWQIFYRPQ